jgi:acyl-coenzyme A synthetase/AMP-(fatty) acid ligase
MATVPKTQPNMRSYEDTRASIRWPTAAHFNFATDVVDTWGADPELVAMGWIGDAADRTLTFRHFAERSDRFANALEELGFAAGDHVLIRKKA